MKNTIVTTLLAIAVSVMMSGCTMTKMGIAFMGMESETQDAYAKMMENISQYGDPARAMMIETKIKDDVSNDDAVESIKAVTEERNMMVTGDVKMFRKDDAKPDEVAHARIISVCNLRTAKVFLNFSRYYGGFMPCRILLIEYGNGDRFLVTMDLTMAIYGGDPLPPEMLEAALIVKETMEMLITKGAAGDF